MAAIPRPLRLLLLLLPALVVANPSKIGCNLITTDNSRAVMTSTTNMMGYAPSTDAGIITSQSATTFTAASAVTFTLDSSKAYQGVMHATAGSVAGTGYSAKSGCTGTNVMMVDNSGTSTTGGRTVTWTAPSDVSGISSVTISFVIGPGYGQIYRTSVSLSKAAPTTGAPSNSPSNSPTTLGPTDPGDTYAPSNSPTGTPTTGTPTTGTPTVAPTYFTYTGYVIDNYCWDKAGHQGIDGAYLCTAPQTHILHCMVVSQCIAGGYAILEPLSTTASDGCTFGIKYQLDTSSNALVRQLVDSEISRAGDRQFTDQLAVSGTVNNNVMTASSVCVTSSVNNADGDTFCQYAPTPAPSAAAPTPAPTVAITTVSQAVVVSSLDSSSYSGTLKTNYEKGYGVAVGACTSPCSSYNTGVSISSSAASRRAATVTFVMTLTGVPDTSTYTGGCSGTCTSTTLASAISTATSTTVTVATISTASVIITGSTPAPTPDCGSTDAAYDYMTAVDGSGLELHWKLSDTTVDFKLTHTSSLAGWLSLAVNDNALMVGGDAVIGQTSGVSRYHLNGKSSSGVVQMGSSSQDLTNEAYSYSGGIQSISFTRPLAANGGKAIAASGANAFLWAYGTGSLGYHGGSRGSISIDLASCASQSLSVDDSKYTTHGWLMTIGWGVVLPLGALFASATRGDQPVLPTPHWPKVHMGIQIAGVVLFTIGFTVAVVATDDVKGKHLDGTHQLMGLIVCIVGWLQLLMAFVRPANNPEKESLIHKIWSWKHRILGVGMLVLAIINIFSGMSKHGVSTTYRWLFAVWLLLLLAAFISLYAYKGRSSKPEPDPEAGLTNLASDETANLGPAFVESGTRQEHVVKSTFAGRNTAELKPAVGPLGAKRDSDERDRAGSA